MSNYSKGLTQGLGAYVERLNMLRIEDLKNSLSEIMGESDHRINQLLEQRNNAIKHIDCGGITVQQFLESKRGGQYGNYGFIAESVEVSISNARRAYEGLRANLKLINDNGPADIKIGRGYAQMKMREYIGQDLDFSSKYHGMKLIVSKENYETYAKIMQGETNIIHNGEKLSSLKISNIREKIEMESKFRGMPFTNWMKGSVTTRSDYQGQAAQDYLDSGKAKIEYDTNKKIMQENKTLDESKSELISNSGPSLDEALKVAAFGGVVQGSMDFILYIIEQNKAGKNLWEFDQDDWIDAGKRSGKGIFKGSVNGISLYSLTNFAGVSAPAASALSSAMWSMGEITLNYRNGNISSEEFTQSLLFTSLDTSASALGATIGQMVIPVPIFGSILGSIMGTTVLKIGKDFLTDEENHLLESLNNQINSYVSQLEDEYVGVFKELKERFDRIDSIQELLLDVQTNIEINFINSITLAEELDDIEDNILKNLSDIDNYFIL